MREFSLTWVEATPFIASFLFVVAGGPLSDRAYDRLESALREQHVSTADAVRAQAESFGALARLPQTVFLTGLGICLAFDGQPWTFVVLLILLLFSLNVQKHLGSMAEKSILGHDVRVITLIALGINLMGITTASFAGV